MNATSFGNTAFPANVTDELSRPIELTVVVPTFNERDNIEPLLRRLERALEGISWEVIFVDDDFI